MFLYYTMNKNNNNNKNICLILIFLNKFYHNFTAYIIFVYYEARDKNIINFS